MRIIHPVDTQTLLNRNKTFIYTISTEILSLWVLSKILSKSDGYFPKV